MPGKPICSPRHSNRAIQTSTNSPKTGSNREPQNGSFWLISDVSRVWSVRSLCPRKEYLV